MHREVCKVPEVIPADFWLSRSNTHIHWLKTLGGLENFKRTLAFNYHQWTITSKEDYQLKRLEEICFADGLPDDPYQRFVILLWGYALSKDKHKILERVSEPLVGNPIRIERDDVLLSQDLAHTARECNLLLDYVEPSVVGELGAGHGRIAHVLHTIGKVDQYVIFDIPPALVVSEWYISQVFPGEKIFRFRPFDSFAEIQEELSQCRFAFFSANQLEKFPAKYFDLFINVCSLMEMSRHTVEYYLKEIDRVTSGHFYTKQWKVRSRVPDGIMGGAKDYPIPKDWTIVVDKIDDVNVKLFEQLWRIA